MSKRSSGVSWSTFALVLGGAGLAAVTSPAQEAHIDALKAECAQSSGQFAEAMCGLALSAGRAFGATQYHDYVIFSTLSFGGQTRTVGALGYVYVMPHDALR